MFEAIRRSCDTIFDIRVDAVTDTLTVRVDRERIVSHGRPALSKLLMSLHIFRSTADVSRCRALMRDLTTPTEECLEWRSILLRRGATKRVFVQSNTFLLGHNAISKDYETSPEGMIQSWAEREV